MIGGVVVVLAWSGASQAELMLNVDTTSKEFWLTGSDTGSVNGDGRVSWSLGNGSSYQVSDANLGAVSSSSYSVSQLRMGSVNSAGATFGVWVGFYSPTYSDSSPFTLTGAGASQKVSYAGMDATTIAKFESGIGHLLNLSDGSGFQKLNMMAAGVPEIGASGVGSVVMLLAGGLGLIERRRRAA